MNESMKKENNKEGLYSPKGKVSLGQAVPMALQHVVATVSYTHLDVYKRQRHHNTPPHRHNIRHYH